MVDHIKSPTEESTTFLKETMNDIELALHDLKYYRPRKPKLTEMGEKRPQGRPRVPHRAILENGKYDTRPTDPDYHKKILY